MIQNAIIFKNNKIFYSEKGKGTAVVLLHGFLENSTMWNSIADELVKRNRVICIDLLGHGKTDCIGYVHTMDEMANTVKAVVKHLGIRRFYMIGHSMGGYVALTFADKYAKNLKGLCLLNSTAQADSEAKKELRLRACKMAQTSYKSLVKMSVSNLFSSESKELYLNQIEQVIKEALQTSVQGYIAATKGMLLRKNKEAILQTIPKRLLIAGKKDPILNYQSILEESQRTNTPLQSLENGHMSYIEDSNNLVKYLKSFINS